MKNKGKAFASGVELVRGLGAIVYEVLSRREGTLWNSRELAEAISKHPEFLASKQSPERVANTWIFKLRKLGLITYESS